MHISLHVQGSHTHRPGKQRLCSIHTTDRGKGEVRQAAIVQGRLTTVSLVSSQATLNVTGSIEKWEWPREESRSDQGELSPLGTCVGKLSSSLVQQVKNKERQPEEHAMIICTALLCVITLIYCGLGQSCGWVHDHFHEVIDHKICHC